MRLSISTKIFLGFSVVLLSLGGAAVYGAWAAHTLGQQPRLVALGYSGLRIEMQDQLTLQANILKRLSDPELTPRLLEEVAADRRRRQQRLEQARTHVEEMRRTLAPGDRRFLDGVAARLLQLSRLYAEGDPLFDLAYGHGHPDPDLRRALREHEEQAAPLLEALSKDLTDKVVEVIIRGEKYADRALYMTIFLAIGAVGIGFLVMVLMQATLRPLRRLSDSARAVARGNYRQRVAASTKDEIGALGMEFNAMAAALEEREQRLRRSEQLAAAGKMAAQITHEVRNPLSSIGLNAELLADEVADAGTEAQTLAKAIVREVDRLTDITEQYLRFARLPEPRLELEDVSTVLRGLLQFMAEDLSARGVTVAAELQERLPLVSLDENQLRPALLNLLRNAAEAMAGLPGARLLTVRTRLSGDRVAIDIIDSGPGIPAEHEAHIFEPFFTTKAGGTGLGLALAHEVIARHGGTLRAMVAPTGGAQFTIELPMVRTS